MCNKRKLNLTDKFVYGSVLPDILKHINNDRTGTHYLETVVANKEQRNLPDIYKAIMNLDIEDKEIKMGYIAHLIEDYIWFDKYVPSYVQKIGLDQIKYISNGSVHTGEEFRNDMYLDYSNSSKYIITKCNIDIKQLLSSVACCIKDENHIKIILDNTKYAKDAMIETNKFMTKESIDRYIEESAKEVENMVLKLMGE